MKIDKAVITHADSILISVKVKNTGMKAGAEVVQLYAGFPHSKIDMPEKLLRGFQKIYLQPGEEKLIDFTLVASNFAYYDTANKQWLTEKGNYNILIGNSSNDQNLISSSINIQ
jgi:beta-glucosidase